MSNERKTAKRIAMIGHKFIPSRDGGIEVVVSSLAPHLKEIGYDVTCYNRTKKEFKKMRKTTPLPKEYRGVRLIWTPTVDRRGLAAVTSSIAASVMAAFSRYDLIHYHAEGPCVLCCGCSARRLLSQSTGWIISVRNGGGSLHPIS